MTKHIQKKETMSFALMIKKIFLCEKRQEQYVSQSPMCQLGEENKTKEQPPFSHSMIGV